MKTVDELMKKAFEGPRDPRSPEYKAGVRAALNWNIRGIHIKLPYSVETAQADAFFAGTNEGHRIYREYQYAKELEEAKMPTLPEMARQFAQDFPDEEESLRVDHGEYWFVEERASFKSECWMLWKGYRKAMENNARRQA